MWVEQYKPKTLKDVVGNKGSIAQLVKFFYIWDSGAPEKKAACLVGPSGVGKTLSSELIAKMYGYDFVELNASDERAQEQVLSKLATTRTESLYEDKKGVVLLFDEVDGMKGDVDKGGMQALKTLINKTMNPIILTANDINKERFLGLRDIGYIIEFYPLSADDIVQNLKRIAVEARKDIDDSLLIYIGKICDGDMRRAINLLQTYYDSNGDLTSIEQENRSGSLDLELGGILLATFSARSLEECIELLELSTPNPIVFQLWVEEALCHTIKSPEKLSKALEHLAKASAFVTNHEYGENHAYYAQIAMAIMQKEQNLHYPTFPSAFRTRPRKCALEVARALARFCHVSERYALSRMLVFIKIMASDKAGLQKLISAGLPEEYLKEFLKGGATTK